MLPRRFELHRPGSLEGVFALLDRYGEDASVYAGGTELLIALKVRVLHYAHLIDLKGLRELAAIRQSAEGLVVGALATHHRIAHDATVRALAPAYAQLSNNIANIRVRCAGTIGGNLCFAESHADPPALLAALDARVRLQSAAGQRECAVADFIHGEFETDRRADELMTAIVVPSLPSGAGAGYCSFGQGERPAAGAAAVIAADKSGKSCDEARLWIGAAGPRPVRLAEAEAALKGVALHELPGAVVRIAAAEIGKIDATDDIHGSADYKLHLAGIMLQRAVAAAAGQSDRKQTA